MLIDALTYGATCETDALPPREGPFALGIDLGGTDGIQRVRLPSGRARGGWRDSCSVR